MDRLGHFNCDPSRAVSQMAMRRMAAAQPAPAFLLLGGDNFGHVPPASEDAAAVRASHVTMAYARPGLEPQTSRLQASRLQTVCHSHVRALPGAAGISSPPPSLACRCCLW